MQPSDPQFRLPPFPAFPSVTRYVAAGSIADTMSRISRSIEAREGLSLVMGPPGTGKSLVCALVVDEYRETHDVVVLGETPIEDQAAFLRHLLHHMGADFDAIPERDLQLALIDRVCDPQSPPGGLLIVVDEAQALSRDVLESIRMVTNIMRNGEPRVYAVVCGGVKLDETLSEPSMEAFAQRVATRCYLHPLSCEETRHYVCETIKRCGAEPDETITDEAIAAVHHACNGVPRLLNHMLTQAIDCAEASDQSLISEQVIDQAWAELQQLPSPMVEEPSLGNAASDVEFGELDEPENHAPAAPHENHRADDDASPTAVVEYGELPRETNDEACEAGCDTSSCDPETCRETNCLQGQCSTSSTQVTEDIQSLESSEDCSGEADPSESSHESPAMDELQVMTQTLVPPSAVLFGEFEEEEEVVVGSGVPADTTSHRQQPADDLEAKLHEEIVGLANDAAEQVAQDPIAETEHAAPQRERAEHRQFEHSEIEHGHLEPTEPAHHEPESSMSEAEFGTRAMEADAQIEAADPQWANEPQGEPADPPQPVLWINESESDDSRGVGDNDLLIFDDQDLLVIEDEIEISPVSIAGRVDAQQETISVDFHAMLARMRSH